MPAARPSSAPRAAGSGAPAPCGSPRPAARSWSTASIRSGWRRPPPTSASKTGAKVTAVAADVATPEGQAALFAACPEPDILIANNAGPPFRDFRELDRQKMIDGVIGNMIVPVELLQKAIDPMIKKKFGRIVNITSGSVKMPLVGLDLSSGARAGLTAFLAGVARSVAQHNVTINFLLPGPFDTDRLRSNHEITGQEAGHHASSRRCRTAIATDPGASGSAPPTSSARPARSCARRTPASSPGRTC